MNENTTPHLPIVARISPRVDHNLWLLLIVLFGLGVVIGAVAWDR